MNFLEKLKHTTHRFVTYVLAAVLVLAGSFSFASQASAASVSAVISALGTGVEAVSEVADIYQDFNPPATGYVTVLNGLDENVTVRSYNNNDWFMAIAAGQINLKPDGDAMITASTDPIKLVWKRGDYSTLDAFGTSIDQSAAPKGYVFIIGEANTR